MADQRPPTDHPPGFFAQVLSRILDYMSTPWRAVVIIILVSMLGLGYGLWQERDKLITVWLAPVARPASLKADVTPELDDLINQTLAEIVAVWAVDLADNHAQFLQARKRGGGAWVFQPRRVPAIVDESDPGALARILAGEPACVDLTTTLHGLVTRGFAAAGMEYLCFIPVPPSAVEPLLAVVVMGWKTRPPTIREAAALGLAAADAAAMVMR